MADAADEDWCRSDPQPVSLTATGGHGAVTVRYVLDGAAQTGAGAASFDVAGAGSHTLEYWATDELGNEESHHTACVNIDTGNPSTDHDYAGGDAWQTGPVSFSLTASRRPVGGRRHPVDGRRRRAAERHRGHRDRRRRAPGVDYWSTDLAGNDEDAHSLTVRIDAGAPETGHDAPAGWTNVDTTVTLTPADALSGMTGGLAETSWELDGGATQASTSVLVTAPSDHSGDGVRTITYRSGTPPAIARRTGLRRSASTRSRPPRSTISPPVRRCTPPR